MWQRRSPSAATWTRSGPMAATGTEPIPSWSLTPPVRLRCLHVPVRADQPRSHRCLTRRVIPGREQLRPEIAVSAPAPLPAPGFSAEVQEPMPSHPGSRSRCIRSRRPSDSARGSRATTARPLIAGMRLIEGSGRQQRVAGLRNAPEPVTIVFSQRIAPHDGAEFVELREDVVDRLRELRRFPSMTSSIR